MKKIIILFVTVLGLFSCSKDDTSLNNNLQLSIKSCVLDNNNSYAEVKKLKGTDFINVTSSDPNVAEIRFDEAKKDVFYIIGHNQGNATITATATGQNETGDNDITTIDVDVNEQIDYQNHPGEVIFIKKGESRAFNLPLNFNKNDSLVIGNEYIASVSANVEMGTKCRIDAKNNGNMEFHICKGKVSLFSVRVFVVNEYDLYIPQSEYRQLTFKLPFTYGVNGISIWRGSGHYSAKTADPTIATVESITPEEDWWTEMSNHAVVRVTPLSAGTTKLIVTDEVTGQTAGVNVEVH